jgi:hypothetical protein
LKILIRDTFLLEEFYVIKLRVRWVRKLAHMKYENIIQNFWLENVKGKVHLGDLGIYGE